MQDTPAIVEDDKEAVEHAEGDRGHGEEVHGRNGFPVIRKKHAPALGWLGVSRNPLHPPGDGPLGHVKAQQEKLAVNARRAPGWVLRHHTEDQPSNLGRQFFPPELLPHSRDPTPVQSKPARCQRTTVSGLTSTRDCIRHPRNDGRIPRRFCQPLPSGVGDACASAPPTVAGERDLPGAGFDAIESSG